MFLSRIFKSARRVHILEPSSYMNYFCFCFKIKMMMEEK